jgi:hypothetical protein
VVGVGGDVAVGADLPGGIGDGHGDGFGVDIETDILDLLGCG